MKLVLISVILTFLFLMQSNAQNDTLVINLKSKQVDKIAVSQIQKIKFENISKAVEIFPAVKNLDVKGNIPNPVRDFTDIEFEIAAAGNVVILIHDISGNLVQKLECPNCSAGKNTLQWNCLDINNKRVQSGIYYYEVRFKSEIQSKKLLIIR